MASKMRSEQNVSENAKQQKHKNASSKLKGKPKQAEIKAPPTTHLALVTDDQMVALMSKIMRAKDRYMSAKSKAKEVAA